MKAQDYSTLEILIGVIFAMSLMVIVVSYLTNLTPPLGSYNLVEEGLESANKLNGKEIEYMIFYRKGEEYFANSIIRVYHLNSLVFISNNKKISCDTPYHCKVIGDVKVLTLFKCNNGNCKIVFKK